MGMVSRFCTDAVLLHRGHMIASGTPDEIVGEYRNVLEKAQGQKGSGGNAERDRQLDYTIAHEDEDDMTDSPNGSGSRRKASDGAEILGVELLDNNREPADRIPSGSNLTVRVHARYAQAVDESVFGVVLRDRSGTLLFATSTDLEGIALGARAEGEVVTVDFTFGLPLRPGIYDVKATVSGNDSMLLGRTETAATFEVVAEERPVQGVVQLSTTVEVHDRDREEQGPAT
jgi:lipopolysaccharide transport system ATP-binding protein